MRPDRTLSRLHLALGFVVLAALCLPLADLTLAGHDPWDTLGRMALGFLRPDFTGIEAIGRALALTVAFAVAGLFLQSAWSIIRDARSDLKQAGRA